MALADFHQSLGTSGNISEVLGNDSFSAVWMFLTRDLYHSLPRVLVSVAK